MKTESEAQQLGLMFGEDRAAGNAGRDAGMQASVEHANDVIDNWGDAALIALQRYVELTRHTFIAPEVRAWAYSIGAVPPAPTAMAWGAVFQRAARMKLIQRVGYRQYGDATMHTQTVAVWERA